VGSPEKQQKQQPAARRELFPRVSSQQLTTPSSHQHYPLINEYSKTRGMGAGRKLQIHRRNQRWADKDYKKSHLGSEWKKPFAGASHAKGIVLEKM